MMIIDLHAHAGEMNLVLMKMRAAALLPCRVRLVNVFVPGKNGIDCEYAMKRTAANSGINR